MQVTKCDKCRKTIADDGQSVYVRVRPMYEGKELCVKCAAPIAQILKRYKIMESYEKDKK